MNTARTLISLAVAAKGCVAAEAQATVTTYDITGGSWYHRSPGGPIPGCTGAQTLDYASIQGMTANVFDTAETQTGQTATGHFDATASPATSIGGAVIGGAASGAYDCVLPVGTGRSQSCSFGLSHAGDVDATARGRRRSRSHRLPFTPSAASTRRSRATASISTAATRAGFFQARSSTDPAFRSGPLGR